MISVTKIFRFEMGHAIYGYEGMCKFIHGHSYVLHVSVKSVAENKEPIQQPGFVIDFKLLKKIINEKVIQKLDHTLVLSKEYLNMHPNAGEGQNLLVWDYEPSAENILFFIKNEIKDALTPYYEITKLRLWETSESYAEWENRF
ncbi:MAG: 6-carboxytetrahydropterin synthase [Chitinophagaceae bacterium]|nr:MAG: 6-pyruvoyl-tetrahydropterin synthase [Bacteroidetes bacterium OLB11]MCC6448375.1 6-carboxytetrahydropterin synthase [Chitinophagaceae bacterium]HMN33481.1 6-carboxytetrahydropterin synthase [Chitinophagaceae bacterium]